MSKKGNVLRINHFSGLEETALYTVSLQEALEKRCPSRGVTNQSIRPTLQSYRGRVWPGI